VSPAAAGAFVSGLFLLFTYWTCLDRFLSMDRT
jgi:hypothetical protein